MLYTSARTPSAAHQTIGLVLHFPKHHSYNGYCCSSVLWGDSERNETLHALSRNQSRDNVALPAEKRRVFLAYRSLFSGDNANLRQAKKIRKLVQKHSGSFGALIKDFGSDKTVDILKTLLEVRVFESDIQAKITFPDLFQTTLSRSVQRAASVNEVARSEAEALEELVLGGRINEFDEDADVERVYATTIEPT
ncbi:hypothetical protein V499_02558 [Pseudogymnoascus sp. VKM F-103]|nr:hypothetical protein V499_02558 [Pseudogymnoascus sp. VKM F-103]